MAAGPKAQYAHLANLAADFVRKRPNRACPPPFRGRVSRAREPSHRAVSYTHLTLPTTPYV